MILNVSHKSLFAALFIHFVISSPGIFACTGFLKETGDKVYFAANEDWHNPYSKIWTIPKEEDSYGILVLGFSDMFPQTMINDQGLAMDGFATVYLEVEETGGKKTFKGDLFLEVLKKCSTVEEVLEMISEYKLDFLSQAQIFMGDKTGDSAVIEGDVIHRKENSYQVVTNFYLSRTEHISCYRYNTASRILNAEDYSNDDLSTVLQMTSRGMLTQYSYIFNLTGGAMELYFFGDFEKSVTFDISGLLERDSFEADMSDYFENDDYDLYLAIYHNRKPRKTEEPISDISKYTGYYYISSIKTGFEITESDGELFLILEDREHQMFLSKGGTFFFDRLDYVLRFQEKSSEKIDGIEYKHTYDGSEDFAKKVHPIWYWFLTGDNPIINFSHHRINDRLEML